MRVINLNNLSISEFRRLVQQIITNAQVEDDVRAGLADFGVRDADFETGQALFDAFSETVLSYQELWGKEKSAIQKRDDAIEALRDGAFAKHLARANVAFKSDVRAQSQLHLTSLNASQPTLSDWMADSQDFYGVLLKDDALFAQMATKGATRDELEEGAAAVAAIHVIDQEHVALVGLRQQARRDRDAKREDLTAWVRDLQGTARNVFPDRPDLLELLGFVVS